MRALCDEVLAVWQVLVGCSVPFYYGADMSSCVFSRRRECEPYRTVKWTYCYPLYEPFAAPSALSSALSSGSNFAMLRTVLVTGTCLFSEREPTRALSEGTHHIFTA